MCQAALSSADLQVLNARRDPTRTTAIRNRFAADMNKRFRIIRGLILDAIVNKDCFGLADVPPSERGITANTLTLTNNAESGLPRRAFAFTRSADKVSAFMRWLEQQANANLLELSMRQRIGMSIEGAWHNVYIEDTYKRGVLRAAYEMDRMGIVGNNPILDMNTIQGGLNAVLNGGAHADRLGVLYTRAFNELKGITAAMDQQISRVLTQGLADGDGPRLLARKLNATISGKGRQSLGITDSLGRSISPQRRAEMLARTETIRAHHQGMMQEYRNWQLQGVVLMAELSTANDDRVCAICAGLEGQVFSLDEAQNLIPLHPMCRCIMLPAREEDFRKTLEGQVAENVEWQDMETAEEFINQFKEMNVVYGMHSGIPQQTSRLAEWLDKMPEAKRRVNDVGRALREDIFNKLPRLHAEYKKMEYGRRSLGFMYTDRLGVGTSGTQYSTYINLKMKRFASSTSEVSIGRWFTGDSARHTVRHEFGHFIDNNMWTPQTKARWKSLFDSQGGVNSQYWKDRVSQYGASEPAELWAEAFAAYTSPKYKKGMLPQEIEDFIMEELF